MRPAYFFAVALILLAGCSGPVGDRGVCIGVFRLADQKLDPNDEGSVADWTDDARDLVTVAREQAQAGSPGLTRPTGSLDAGIKAFDAGGTSIAMGLVEDAMNSLLVYCDPYAEDYYGGGP